MKTLVISLMLCVPGSACFPAWLDWSRNNIVSYWDGGGCGCTGDTFTAHQIPIIDADSGHTSTTDIGNISHNFFGDASILPENQVTGTGCNSTDNRGAPSTWTIGGTGRNVALGICYNADSNRTTWQDRVPGTIDCEASLPDKARQKGAKPQSVLFDTTCQIRYAIGVSYNDNDEYAKGYPALMSYLETCYDSGQAWHAFVDLDNSVQFMSSDDSRFENYREWLKSVLWLNQIDPYWYCICVRSILFTYQWDTTARGTDYNAEMAIAYYIQSTGRCIFDSTYYRTDDSGTRAAQRKLWLDTVNQLHNGDTKDFPEDTTLPTLQQLGMEILIGPPASVDTSSSPQTGIGLLTASENPFTKETTVSFSMGEYAYISFQVFDVLGKVVQGDYKGTVIGPGEHSFTVDGTNWAAGTYYARITTPIGETRMIKLVKE